MEAKKTVMTMAKINSIRFKESQKGKGETVTGWCKIIAKAQAEISFKAGIKEVVEWLNKKLLDGYIW